MFNVYGCLLALVICNLNLQQETKTLLATLNFFLIQFVLFNLKKIYIYIYINLGKNLPANLIGGAMGGAKVPDPPPMAAFASLIKKEKI